MTTIVKTSQLVAFNTHQAEKAHFNAKATLIALHQPQTSKIKLVRPPSSVQNVIIQTNGKLRTFKVTPQGNRLLLSTPKNVPFATLPNNTASLNALKASATALGTGEVATGAGTASGFLTLGTLATLGLSLVAFGATFLVGMGSANSEEEQDFKNLQAQKTVRLKKQAAQDSAKPKFKPLNTPLLTPPNDERSFTQNKKPDPFNPKSSKPLARSKPLPNPRFKSAPKGGGVTTPYVDWVKLNPFLNPDKKHHQKPKYTPRVQPIKASAAQGEQAEVHLQPDATPNQLRAAKLKSSSVQERNGRKWETYMRINEEWHENNNIKLDENSDPLNPDNSQPIGFHSINGVTMYQYAPGQYYDASIFDSYLNNTLPTQPITTSTSQIEKGSGIKTKAKIQSAQNDITQQLANISVTPQNVKEAKPKEKKIINQKLAKPKTQKAPAKVKRVKVEKPKIIKQPKPPKPPKDATRQKSALQFAQYKQGIINAKNDYANITVTDTYTNQINEQIEAIYAEISAYRIRSHAIRLILAKQSGSNITPEHHNFTQTQQAIESDRSKQSIQTQVSQTLDEANKALQEAKNIRSRAITYRSIQETNLKKLEEQTSVMQISASKKPKKHQLIERVKSRDLTRKSRAKSKVAAQKQLPPQQ
jgi:hypothetical protein